LRPVTGRTGPGTRELGSLLLADISGYTGFLQGVADAHRALIIEADEPPAAYELVSSLLDGLGLKFVLHHGEYVVQHVAGSEELFGADVNAAHRLLKNHAVDLIGPRPYALLTDAATTALGIPAETMTPTLETYPDVPPIPAHILPLDQPPLAPAA
jgi:hypothetical protein